jgi:hypothetical protein
MQAVAVTVCREWHTKLQQPLLPSYQAFTGHVVTRNHIQKSMHPRIPTSTCSCTHPPTHPRPSMPIHAHPRPSTPIHHHLISFCVASCQAGSMTCASLRWNLELKVASRTRRLFSATLHVQHWLCASSIGNMLAENMQGQHVRAHQGR